MGLGILEPATPSLLVPGTTRYYDDPDRPQHASAAHATTLNCDTSGAHPIILVPQPSDDPNDPLNWPLWQRDLITALLSVTAIFATALGPILAANTVAISYLFAESFTRVALLTGYFLLGAGAAAVLFVPSARLWGKRHCLVAGLVLVVASSAAPAVLRGYDVSQLYNADGSLTVDSSWAYNSLLAARVVQGVGCAPWESLVNAAVGDLYHVHQRGLRMALTNLAVFGGAFFTPVVVGDITEAMGWWWSFIFVAIFCAVLLPAVVLFCPETAFRRDAVLNTDINLGNGGGPTTTTTTTTTTSSSSGSSAINPEHEKTGAGPLPNTTPLGSTHHHHGGDTATPPSPPLRRPKKTFVQSLHLFDGRKTDETFWKLLLRPFPLFLHPAFLWACLIQGTMIGWTVFIGVLVAAVFQGPPFFFTEAEAGHAYVGPFVGALVGFAFCGLLADPTVRWMTRRNNGVYEPEFRILLVIPMLILGAIGLYGFAITASQIITGKYSKVVPLVFFGFEVAGMVVGAVASSLYIVDAYRDLAIEAFTCTIIFKNIFSFILTFYAYDWIIQAGARKVILIIASVQVAVCLTSIPMYIFGKRIRAYFHKHDMLAYLNLR